MRFALSRFRRRIPGRWIDDPLFLRLIDLGERQVAKLLAGLLFLVTLVAALQLSWVVLRMLFGGSDWLGGRLIGLLGDLLNLLIALEVLQNLTGYLRRRVVQIELVLLTAMTAVARKVIVLPAGSENKPELLLGLGVVLLCLAVSWWLVRAPSPARTEPARSFPEQDP
jgi:hypothetical protein